MNSKLLSPGLLALGAATLSAHSAKDFQPVFAVDKATLGVKGANRAACAGLPRKRERMAALPAARQLADWKNSRRSMS